MNLLKDKDFDNIEHIIPDTLVHGDCLKWINKIPEKSIDAIICDLPYGTTANRWDAVLPFDEMWESYKRVIKPKGNIILFAQDIFAFKLALSNEKMFRYSMVWAKSKCGSPLTAKYMPMKKHEMILVFGESASYYEPQMQPGEPYTRRATPHKANNHKYGIAGNSGIVNEGTRHPSTVLQYAQKWRRQDQVHPTQKPIELMSFLVKSYCPENGIVLDNCMGSGTTCLAAYQENRRFIGMDITEEYVEIAKKRIEENKKEPEEKDHESLF